MSFSASPTSALFAMPVAVETPRSATDRRAHDEANHQRHRRPHATTPSPGEPTAASPDPNPEPRLGTLIDVQA